MFPRVAFFLGVFPLRCGCYFTGFFFSLVYLTGAVAMAALASKGDAGPAVTYVFLGVLCGLLLASCCSLVWGTYRLSSAQIRCWLMVHGVVGVVAVVTFAVATFIFLFSDVNGLGAAFLAGCVCSFLSYGYGLIVVFSYYKSLKSRRHVIQLQPGPPARA